MAAPTTLDDPTAADAHAFPYRPALDGLRAVAVLAVIAFHNGYAWAIGGFLGVDAFFVLSGFLITTLLVLEYRRATAIGLTAFWARRVRRLFPALLLVLAFCAAYAVLFLHPVELGAFRWDALSSLVYATNWRFIASGQSYFDLFATPSPVRHLWSLAIEEQFYLVWPLVVLGCLRLRKGRLDLLVALCVAGIAASATAMAWLYHPRSPSRAYYGTDTHAHTILIGALLALAVIGRPRLTGGLARAVQVAGVLALVVVAWSFHTVNGAQAGYYRFGALGFGVAVAVVVLAAVQTNGWFGRILGAPPLRLVGLISYGLYLWHWPVIVWLPYWRVGFGASKLVALRLAITVALATASYLLVEAPIRHGRWPRRRSTWARLAAPVALALTAGLIIASASGAQKPPAFMGGFVLPCGAPDPGDVRAARHFLDRHGTPEVAGRPLRVAVIGDSVACSLAAGLQALRSHSRWRFTNHAVIGCGVVSGEVLASEAIPLTSPLSDHCRILGDDAWRAAVADRPALVVWLSTWERADLAVDGRRLTVGSRAWRAELDRRIAPVIRAVHGAGARLVMLTAPAHSEGQLMSVVTRPRPADTASFDFLNRWILGVAAAHPDTVSVVDLAGIVCPGGAPCPRTVDGVAPRPFDGGHFDGEGGAWALERLLPRLAAVAGAPSPRA